MQTLHPKVLSAAASGKFDLNAHAKKEAANRGIDQSGKWVGFDKAKEIHGGGQGGASATKPAAKKPAAQPMHYRDLQEGDEVVGPNGEKHEFSHVEQGLGRKNLVMRSGHKFPADKGTGHLTGWEKTGKNGITKEGFTKSDAIPLLFARPSLRADA